MNHLLERMMGMTSDSIADCGLIRLRCDAEAIGERSGAFSELID